MCEPKPGPRCTPHTKNALDKATHAYNVVKDDSTIADDTKQKFKRELEVAKWDYLTSPGGIKELKEQVDTARQAGDTQRADAIEKTHDKAVNARKEQRAALKEKRRLQEQKLEDLVKSSAKIAEKSQAEVARIVEAVGVAQAGPKGTIPAQGEQSLSERLRVASENANKARTEYLSGRQSAIATAPAMIENKVYKEEHPDDVLYDLAKHGDQYKNVTLDFTIYAGGMLATNLRNNFNSFGLETDGNFSFREERVGLLKKGFRIKYSGNKEDARTLMEYFSGLAERQEERNRQRAARR